jgi:hypothetical protein
MLKLIENMKKLNLVLLCLMLSFGSQTAKAGDDKHESKIGGVRAGWQKSALYDNGSTPQGFDPLSSFYVGVYKEIKVVPLFRVGGGVEFSQIGMSGENTAGLENMIKLQYVYIPLYAKLKLGPVFILGGGSPSFKVGEKQEIAGVNQEITSDNKANAFDFPVFLGAGVKVFFITVEARYGWGTIDVYENNKSQYLQVGAAISF